jgi:serine/threonine protein kinase
MGPNAGRFLQESAGSDPPSTRSPGAPASSQPRAAAAPDSVRQLAERYVGTTVDDRYVVEKLLSRGGMGAVYLCRRTVIDKLVAMKVLRPEFMHDLETAERFITEAKAATAIGSPHIVEVFDFGTMPDGCTYFVMEFLDGDSLANVIHREHRLEPERMIAIAKQIAEGLGAAHDVDIVHRDLKPDNLVLLDRGKTEFVKILDFGLAKVARGQGRLTRVGKVFGTPHYMSPEQARGKGVDRRTDIYALGVIMYEMLTGRVPFDGDTPLSILSGHVHGDVPPLRPPDGLVDAAWSGLEIVVRKCLAKDPGGRYSNMRAVAEDLELVRQGREPLGQLESSPSSEADDETLGDIEALVAALEDWGETRSGLAEADDWADSTQVDDAPLPKPSEDDLDEESEATEVDPAPLATESTPPPPPPAPEHDDDAPVSVPARSSRQVPESDHDARPLPDGEPGSDAVESAVPSGPTTERMAPRSTSRWALTLGVVLLFGLVLLTVAARIAQQRGLVSFFSQPSSASSAADQVSPRSLDSRGAARAVAEASGPVAALASRVPVTAAPGSSWSPANAGGAPAPSPAPSTPLAAPSASATSPLARVVVVDIVPSDAEVFVNGTSAGPPPVTVEMTLNKPVKIDARREGYWRRIFWIDGSKTKVRSLMVPIPKDLRAGSVAAPKPPAAVDGSAQAPTP